MIVFLAFLLGICFGSFFNVVIDRIPRSESIVKGRSHCDFCGHTLQVYDLIPLFSWGFLRGKCRYCHRWIGWKYPLLELTTGILFILIFWQFMYTPLQLLLTLVVASILLILFFSDLWYGILPDVVLIPLIVATSLYTFFFSNDFIGHINAAFGAFVLFLAIYLLTRGKGMGMGDVKYVFFMGIFLGWPNIFVGLYLAFLTGAVASLILILWGKKSFKKSTIPFGPFLILGTTLALLWGNIFWQQLMRYL